MSKKIIKKVGFSPRDLVVKSGMEVEIKVGKYLEKEEKPLKGKLLGHVLGIGNDGWLALLKDTKNIIQCNLTFGDVKIVGPKKMVTQAIKEKLESEIFLHKQKLQDLENEIRKLKNTA